MISKDEAQPILRKPSLRPDPQPKRIKLHKSSGSQWMINSVFISLILITIYTLTHLNTENVKLSDAFHGLGMTLNQIFFQPNAGSDGIVVLLQALGSSVLLAIVTTIIGAVVGFVLAVLASRNLTNAYLGAGIRSAMAIIRAIPTILWALIFSIAVGLGPAAAIMGLSFHSIAYLTKAYSESIEEIDQSTIEALKVTGCKFWVIVFQAVWPTIIPSLVSWTFIRLEINFANAIAVGAAAGAGGIGYQLFVASGMSFDFHEVGMIVYMVIIVAMLLEFVAVKIRQHYLTTK
ncbi:PhnE/PtxC family ABC transporter permease [Companilactobacillus mishanensis]|uniref:ABC transporter permease subunit n=1 Tax=Companilactobacillus mishanensis TaxID=2486008 RepID=A0A5P0ZHA5_9LACO|nr:ABC transporter permease subunit [Companilactobacillus mishanensis]MQS44874.1 ABC transporter permease subunit [Companilactobacillus mishanensis]MQS52447.1 ABC transporter permease subunit [Companilactobacillus mishanensis]MQS89389.1 ABC transporter permease subunit [Companilactobacillus mishanensis]